MNTYKLTLTPNGDILLDHGSVFYPKEFEEKLNGYAGEIITVKGPHVSFMLGFCNSFCIKKEKWTLFVEKCLPFLGVKEELNNNVVWDLEELTYSI